jgi:hypothetical protein
MLELQNMKKILFFLSILIFSCSKNSTDIDPIINCDDDIFGLKTDFREFCSIYSEYGSVLLKEDSKGKEYSFWYTFADDTRSYEFSFVCKALIKGTGTYEFTPPQSTTRTFDPNSAWIGVGFDRKTQIPWNFNFITPKKIRFNI